MRRTSSEPVSSRRLSSSIRFAAGVTTLAIAVLPLAALPPSALAQQDDSRLYSEMRWREIGPTRSGRARALDGVASEPNVFYVGFDNGGVWRSTDYGSTWHPLFDAQSTGSIGAIAVAQSDPNIIYVGTGAGIIRPDLATGNGMYKSTDAGKTWTHLGLRETQMIAEVDVDPRNPNRLFVAALGHPYGPNEERGIFRSTDGGRSFEKVLYKDEYTSGNDVVIDPRNPDVVYAALWQQQESFREGSAFSGGGGGIFKSTDGGATWKQLKNGLPAVLQANLSISQSNPNILYAVVAEYTPPGQRPTGGEIGFYKSTDGGEHWSVVNGDHVTSREPDSRPMSRIGGGDLPTIAVDPTNPDVVYSASVVMWRTEDGGHDWRAVRGAPGGDDYQKIWINPNDPKIVLVVTDQGAVVSANRGESWSNWYTQPAAAMYHVTADNDFPYRLCGGQQDAGSACVKSRSADGEITFNDWHPVNIQEYGIAAPDPRDPDLVYGSMRRGVSLFNRRTRQTTYVGPDMRGTDANGNELGRNVRTMPLQWSPVNPDVLFYVSNVVWKSADHAHSWKRISPDLARSTWEVPATAGKYAPSVEQSPQGAITALSASPRKLSILWAGTDDGAISVTMDGGAHWTNVTPPAIKPWTRIFNIDAGHFDDGTAYAAANTMRIDDMNPHFYRTHDGGKTWTEIDNGIEPGYVANSIREDPRQKGLLYAATDAQVWVSFDDGDHWSSLRMNMPAISVRDIAIKDDTTCLCADLVAGTHGRGFWILDDVTPLRQAAAARAAKEAYLFAPVTALRVRFATNDPTPWPPEILAGENPPAGGIIDYYLAADVSGPVKMQIVDAAGDVVRSYSSADPVMDPHPAIDREKYEQICEAAPTTVFCRFPLYWPAPPMVISTKAGMHRVEWDLHYQPVGDKENEETEATGAVPGRSYPAASAPWAPPGKYRVRLIVNGNTYEQPLTLRLDPRVKTPAAGLAKLASLSTEMYKGAVAAHEAYEEARTLSEALEKRGSSAASLRARVDSIAPAPDDGARPRFRRGPTGPATTLNALSDAMLAAAMSMQGADVAPTSMQIAECTAARAQFATLMGKWRALKAEGR